MLGKLRVELSPRQPNWMFTALYLNARGVTTGTIPWAGTSLEALLDVFSTEIILRRSTGDERRIALVPARTIADVYADIHDALRAFEVACTLRPVPQEVADTTPFDRDSRAVEFDPAALRAWFTAVTATAGVFDDWRAHFFGRSGIQLWWGAFDVALMLFDGRKAAPPADRGYLLTYDLDAALMNCGLYLGDENTAPFFYGYIYPQPRGAETFAMRPAAVTWSDALREWVLPYERVRTASEPGRELRAFLDALYEHCVVDAGWDRDALTYTLPPRVRHRNP